jgi:uncharacterized protein
VITYVDTSVVVKLLIDEPGSTEARKLWVRADDLVSVVLVVVEARAALAAARRARRLTAPQHRRAVAGLDDVLGQTTLVGVTDGLVERAAGLAETAALRAYDAVHLAAALLVDARVMASTDRALGAAAAVEGLHVADLSAPG